VVIVLSFWFLVALGGKGCSEGLFTQTVFSLLTPQDWPGAAPGYVLLSQGSSTDKYFCKYSAHN